MPGCSGTVPTFGSPTEFTMAPSGRTVNLIGRVVGDATSTNFTLGIYRKLGSAPTFLLAERIASLPLSFAGASPLAGDPFPYSDTIDAHGTWHYRMRIECLGADFGGATAADQAASTANVQASPNLPAVVADGQDITLTEKTTKGWTGWNVVLYRRYRSAPTFSTDEIVSTDPITAGAGNFDVSVEDVPTQGGRWYYQARIEDSIGALSTPAVTDVTTVDVPHVIIPGVTTTTPPPTIPEDSPASSTPVPRTSVPQEGVDEHIVLVAVTGTPATGLTYRDYKYLSGTYQRMEWWYHRIGGCGRFRLHLRENLTQTELNTAIDDGWEVHVRIRLPGETAYKLWYRGVIRSVHSDRSGNEIMTELRGYGYVEQMNFVQVQKVYPKGMSVKQVVDDIVDHYLKPHTRILRPYDLRPTDISGVDASPYTLKGDLHFECSALKAIKFLAELQGQREWGVAADRSFYFFNTSNIQVVKNYFLDNTNIKVIGGGKAFSKLNQVKVEGKAFTGREYLKVRNDPTDVTESGLFEKPYEVPWITDDRDADRWADNIILKYRDRENWKTFTWDQVDQQLESNHPNAALGKLQFFGADMSNEREIFTFGKIQYIKGGLSRKGEVIEIGSTVQQASVHQPVITATVFAGAYRRDLVEELEAEVYDPLLALQGKLRQFRNPNTDIILPSEGKVWGEPFALFDPTLQRVVRYTYDATEWVPQLGSRRVAALPPFGEFAGQTIFLITAGQVGVLYYWTGAAWQQVSGGGSASGENLLVSVAQTGHGFSVLDAIRHNGTQWVKAKADSTSTLGTHIVTAVADANNFTAGFAGKFTITGHGLTPAHYYFVSITTAGLLVIDEPTSGASNPLVFVQDANTIWVLPWRPSLLGGSGGSDPLLISVAQTSHGFTAKDVIRWTGTTWVKALANAAGTLGTHIVISVTDANNFTCCSAGLRTVYGHGLTAGHYYYLSDITAGLLDINEPLSQSSYSNPLALIHDVSRFEVFQWRPSALIGKTIQEETASDNSSGDTTTNSASFVAVGSPALAFVQSVAGTIWVTISGTAVPNGGPGDMRVGLGIDLDGSAYAAIEKNLGGSNITHDGFSFTIPISGVAAGSHTLKAAIKYLGTGPNVGVKRGSTTPLTIVVRHT